MKVKLYLSSFVAQVSRIVLLERGWRIQELLVSMRKLIDTLHDERALLDAHRRLGMMCRQSYGAMNDMEDSRMSERRLRFSYEMICHGSVSYYQAFVAYRYERQLFYDRFAYVMNKVQHANTKFVPTVQKIQTLNKPLSKLVYTSYKL